jgi:nucleoid-associated protein YgaU
MGLMDFAGSVGRKIGSWFTKDSPEPTPAVQAAVDHAKGVAAGLQGMDLVNQMQGQLWAALGADIHAAIVAQGLKVDGLSVSAAAGVVTLKGAADTRADQEKAVLIAGNTEHVTQVDDQLSVVHDEPPARFHTVVSGDSLSLVAKAMYGNPMMYPVIFEANRPMITHPDEIYPGQVLRIPALQAATHTIRKGDTLGSIAKAYLGEAGRYTEIATANGIADPNRIAIGQVLKIPLG